MERLSRRRNPSGTSFCGVTPPVVLTIGGSDSSGGSGVQADLKTFAALGVFGACVLTAVTAKNTRQAADIYAMTPAMISSQLNAVLDDMPVVAVKTGMFPDADSIGAVVRRAKSAG